MSLDDLSASPSRRMLGALLVLGATGLLLSGYLTWVHYDESVLVCAVGGCETVQASRYSTIGPIPIAMLGMAMFGTLMLLAGLRFRFDSELLTVAAWGMLLAGILYYLYLTYVELFVLHAVCQWCVVTSLVALAMLVLESLNLWRIYINDDLASAG